jgi:hypothetical protein
MRCNETCFSFSFSEEVMWDDEDRHGPQSIGLFAIQPPDMAASLRMFYWRWMRPSTFVLQHQMCIMYQSLKTGEYGLTGKEQLNCAQRNLIQCHYNPPKISHGLLWSWAWISTAESWQITTSSIVGEPSFTDLLKCWLNHNMRDTAFKHGTSCVAH